MKRNYTDIILAICLILVAASARIINREMHLYNFAPVAAVGLLSGAVFRDKKLAYVMPLIAMFIADLYFQLFSRIPGFYGKEQWFVYGGMMLVTFLGTKMGRINGLKVAGFSLAGSVVFFLVSNFGSFLSGMYGSGTDALMTTYAMAIPFFKKTIAGDLVGSGLLFSIYYLLQRSHVLATEKA